MTASYPSSVWNGDTANRSMALAQRKAPNWEDWTRIVEELAAAQTKIDSNNVATDATAIDSVGAVTSKTGLTVVEKGNGAVHKTVFTFDEVEVASTDGSTAGTDGAWGTQPLYTFPVGHINILGAHAVFPLGDLEAVTGGGTGFSDTADFGIGVGTVAAANSTEFGISTTEENIVAEMDVDLTAKTSDAIESAANGTAATYDGSTSAVVARLNFRTLDDADHGAVADVLKVSGTITIVWSNLGDD
ncbi:hypothetical protein LCGC14_1324930 [marine sediment metagenome]|uniref:Uncharacterized protein n=1 Tax=marine sediment metagenome TaxID=412755 RepID=A0A0F9KIZ1_9ZZZZ